MDINKAVKAMDLLEKIGETEKIKKQFLELLQEKNYSSLKEPEFTFLKKKIAGIFDIVIKEQKDDIEEL